MAPHPSPLPTAVVALGGNALLRRGETPSIERQRAAVARAARALVPATRTTRLVVTHGNGPQVGLLALRSEAFDPAHPTPLDALDAESVGQIGYLVESALDDALPGHDVVTIVTRVRVDVDDPAFAAPTTFIGPGYSGDRAAALARSRGWEVARDGEAWRRVVASPEPREIVERGAIATLVEAGFLVVCAGGGGIPIVRDPDGRTRGVEAVVDKDLTSELLAEDLEADVLVLATDVPAVFASWGTPEARALTHVTPEELRGRRFDAGSMGPKIEAACRFVERTGGRAAIGRLDDLDGLLTGAAGTQVGRSTSPEAGRRAP